ncbi:MAG TPA: DUF104 domain-containing protein [Anaerolineales bacterium]|nr:DUF104 domain-containing protein [Anaerolineales bacterium]
MTMQQTLEATFDGKVFRPVGKVKLQPDTQVQLIVTVKAEPEKKPKSFLRVARSLKLDGPSDWSERVDDYFYGGAELDEK